MSHEPPSGDADIAQDDGRPCPTCGKTIPRLHNACPACLQQIAKRADVEQKAARKSEAREELLKAAESERRHLAVLFLFVISIPAALAAFFGTCTAVGSSLGYGIYPSSDPLATQALPWIAGFIAAGLVVACACYAIRNVSRPS